MICRRCNESKDIKLFVNNKNKPNGKINLCKDCKKKVDKISYQKRKEKINEKKREKIRLFREQYHDLKKDKRCEKCGESKPYMLDFHHINEKEKEFNIGTEAWRTLNIEKIREEAQKCITLCSNHHKEFHYLNNLNNITLDEYINKNGGVPESGRRDGSAKPDE